jgi:YVTN family beta-propeller protein
MGLINRSSARSAFLAALTATGALLAAGVASSPVPERDRSPIDLAVTADGRYALTANATSDTVSLVDLEAGKVLAETPVGKRPFCVALTKDGARGLVSNQWSNTVTLLAVSPTALRATTTLPIGDEPRGVAIAADGSRAFVALAGEDAVAVVDMQAAKVLKKVEVGTEPWHLALTHDGKRLAVGNARSQDMTVLDASTLETLHTVRLRGRNARHVAISPDDTWAYVPHISERGRPATKQNIDLGWVVGNRLTRCPLKEEGPREAIALDTRGKAVGDVDGLAVSPDGNLLALTAGGTHELVLLRNPLPFVAYGGPDDHIEPDLLRDTQRFRRVPLGGRPLGVKFRPDGRTAAIANYLSNAIQIVDTETAQVTKTISLGGPPAPSLERKGEALFYDANRSFNQWYSCNSCHVEGHTNGANFDTFNDGSYETPKKTLSLRGVSKTGPWTWHGWRKTLRELVHDSMTKSMQGPEPSEEDLDALTAFLNTLDWRPNPNRKVGGSLSMAAKRGEAVFNAKGCQACHAGPNYTAEGAYSVGLESPGDVYKGFNPPPLRGVYNRAPYLHNGEARTLEQVLTKYHRPSQLGGQPDCTPEELKDLVEFLRSL